MATLTSRGNPAWVRRLLAQPWVLPLVRLALVSAYLIGGIGKALNFDQAIAEQAHFGLHPAVLWAALAVVVEIGGSLCVVLGRFTWLGAGGLGALTVVAMFAANDFWNLSGAARVIALNSFFEHLGLIAAFVFAAMLGDTNSEADDGRV